MSWRFVIGDNGRMIELGIFEMVLAGFVAGLAVMIIINLYKHVLKLKLI